jgi:hypothetical protein
MDYKLESFLHKRKGICQQVSTLTGNFREDRMELGKKDKFKFIAGVFDLQVEQKTGVV